MDVSKKFTESFNALKDKKELLVPLAIQFLFVFTLMIAFFYQAGISQAIAEVQALDQQHQTREGFNKAFDSWLESGGPDRILRVENLFWLFIYGIVSILSYLYLSSTLYVMASQSAKGERPNLRRGFKESPKFLFRLFWEKVLWFLLFTIPSAVMIGSLVISFMLTPILGFILLLPVIAGIVILPLFLWTKFVFVLPLIYMKDEKVVDAFKQSYGKTSGRFKEAGKVVGVMIGIMILSNVLTQAGFQEGFISYLASTGVFNIFLLIITVLVLSLLQSAFWTLREVFLFHAYREFEG